jgi:hypothetical protein
MMVFYIYLFISFKNIGRKFAEPEMDVFLNKNTQKSEKD